MRVIEVEAEQRSERWIWWMLTGTALGVAAGVLAAEKFSGRRASKRTLWRRVRSLAKTAAAQWGPLVDVAFDLRDAWVERRSASGDPVLEEWEEDEFLDDADEYEEAEPAALAGDDDGEEEEDDEDDELDEDFDDEEFDDDLDEDLDDELDADDADEESDENDSEIGARVLEAFSHDPVLRARAIEIEADDEGKVLLHGSVRASREVAHAVTIARGVPGVTGVRQRLGVRGRR